MKFFVLLLGRPATRAGLATRPTPPDTTWQKRVAVNVDVVRAGGNAQRLVVK